jgi:hypothetical protein
MPRSQISQQVVGVIPIRWAPEGRKPIGALSTIVLIRVDAHDGVNPRKHNKARHWQLLHNQQRPTAPFLGAQFNFNAGSCGEPGACPHRPRLRSIGDSGRSRGIMASTWPYHRFNRPIHSYQRIAPIASRLARDAIASRIPIMHYVTPFAESRPPD